MFPSDWARIWSAQDWGLLAANLRALGLLLEADKAELPPPYTFLFHGEAQGGRRRPNHSGRTPLHEIYALDETPGRAADLSSMTLRLSNDKES